MSEDALPPQDAHALETAHRQWMSALDALETPIFLHDHDFRILRANRAYERLAGHPLAEMVGRPYFEFFPRQNGPLPSCRLALNQSGEDREEFEVEGALYRSRAFAVRDQEGGYRYSVHILEDITEARRAELELQASEERLRGIFDNSPNGVAIYQAVDDGADFLLVDFSPGAEKIEQIARDEVIGRRVTEVFPAVEAFGFLDVLRRVWNSGQGEHFEPKIYQDNRIEGWRDNYVFRLHNGDVVALYRDVTAQKEAEAKLLRSEATYRALFDNSLHGIAHCRMILDAQGRPIDYTLLQVNPAYYQVTGLKNVEGKRVSEVIPGYCENNPESLETFGRVAASGQPERWEHHLKDLGRWYAFGLYSPAPGDFVVVIDDITAKKKAELALQESESRYRSLFESSRDALFVLEGKSLDIVDANLTALAMFDATLREEVVGRNTFDLSAEIQPGGESVEERARRMIEAALAGESAPFEWICRKPGGDLFQTEVVLTPFEIDGAPLFLAALRDISERKRHEAEVQGANDLLRSVVENIPIRVFWKDPDSRYLGCNTLFARDAGLNTPDDLQGKNDFVMGWRDQAELYRDDDRAVMEADTPKLNFEEPQTTPDGGEIWLRTSKVPLHDEHGEVRGVLGVYADITEEKRARDTLAASERRYRSLFENMLNGYAHCRMLYDDDGRPIDYLHLEVNRAFEALTGIANARGKRVLEMIPGLREENPELFERYGRVAKGGQPEIFESYVPGLSRWFKITAYQADADCFVVLFENITERKKHELALQRAMRALRTISAGNQVLIHAVDEEELLQSMCQVAVEFGGYKLAWVGYRQEEGEVGIEPRAHATDLMQVGDLEWLLDGPAPGSRVLAQGHTYVLQGLPQGGGRPAWSAQALRLGLKAAIGLPLRQEQHVFGVLVLLDDEGGVFDPEEVTLLEELADDLAFGISNLRVGQEHQAFQQRLNDTLFETVQTVAAIVEMRDPYTAGHQRRVAELARAIGHELGWDEERCQVLYLAGVVHDVGKINIPSEILSKPSRLTPIEYQYVQSHAQSGYEILKPVHFPWPIAEIVHQHHERLDGSGYPQGLKGDEILPEAKVLMVADAVEAIASHRPYRPSLGMEAALEEIEKKRGRFYDADMVDACLHLIRDKGFSFDE